MSPAKIPAKLMVVLVGLLAVGRAAADENRDVTREARLLIPYYRVYYVWVLYHEGPVPEESYEQTPRADGTKVVTFQFPKGTRGDFILKKIRAAAAMVVENLDAAPVLDPDRLPRADLPRKPTPADPVPPDPGDARPLASSGWPAGLYLSVGVNVVLGATFAAGLVRRYRRHGRPETGAGLMRAMPVERTLRPEEITGPLNGSLADLIGKMHPVFLESLGQATLRHVQDGHPSVYVSDGQTRMRARVTRPRNDAVVEELAGVLDAIAKLRKRIGSLRSNLATAGLGTEEESYRLGREELEKDRDGLVAELRQLLVVIFSDSQAESLGQAPANGHHDRGEVS